VLLVAIACAARAEQRYIVEQLVVNMTAEPANTGDRVAQLKSGDAVEFIEKQGEFAHVRLASGAEGWIKASYLTAEVPLRERLAARDRELDKLRAALAQARAEAAAGAAPAGTKPKPGPSSAANVPDERAAGAGAAAGDSNATPVAPLLAMRETTARPSYGRPVLIVASLAALALGFALGWRTLDRRIRRKYGGLKIY
jgi:hypothetical protein